MSRANIWYPRRSWWKVELGFTHKALLHLNAGPIVPGQKVTLNANKLRSRDRLPASKFVMVKKTIPVSMHIGFISRSIYMKFDGKIMTLRAARLLCHKCGYRSIPVLAEHLRIKHGLPFYGRVVIW